MKLLGAVLLVASGLLAGLAGAARLKRRARLLLDLKTLLQAFQTGYATLRKAWRGWCWKTRRPGSAAWRSGTASSSATRPAPWSGQAALCSKSLGM